MKHHTVDDSYWLAFTIPEVDTLFGTNPKVGDVVRARRQRLRAQGSH